MWSSLVSLGKRFLSISQEEASVQRRGFVVSDPVMRSRLERVGGTFIQGYHLALDDKSLSSLQAALDSIEPEWRDFAYEGAAMALTLLDYFTMGRSDRLSRFLLGPGDAHKYMVHVGAGWALARLPLGIGRPLLRLDPLLKWLAIDGLGFHEGYFRWRKYENGKATRKRPSGYGARVFDQGLGRSLWFVRGGNTEMISNQISAFSASRREDLWSGIGLACAYAGAISPSQLELLRAAAGPYIPALAQGAAFAAKARQRAGNPAAHTEMACQVFCRTSANNAAAITDDALSGLSGDMDVPKYEAWRRRIAAILADQEVVRA